MISARPKREKPLVLHADDEELNRDLLKVFLTEFGLDTVSAANGKQAVALAREHMPELIILDVNMPEMDGFEACQSLKNNPETSAIPIIMLTSLELVADIEKAFASGASDYLTKPIETPRLNRLLTKWLHGGSPKA